MKATNSPVLTKQMYTVQALCWAWETDLGVAMIDGDPRINNGRVYSTTTRPGICVAWWTHV